VRSLIVAVLLLAAAGAAGDAQTMTAPLELHAEVFGSGPPLVALHGFGGAIYSWHSIREELSANHTVHALDMKGFGLSPKPRDGRYSVYDQSALVLAYIADHHLTNVTILGHSFGGGVALATAAELEETQPGVLSKLVLIDAASYKQDLPWFISILRVPLIGSLSQHLLTSRAQVRKVLKNAYYNDKLITAEQVEAYAAPLFMDGGKYALRETAKRILPKNVDELSARYPHIKVPTLIIWGAEDRVVPLANGMRLDDAIPNSTLIKIEKCGHIPHEELPDAVRKPLADFLR
jgi:pimeloyl-ACP methyl ester carboxylesterase